MPLIVLRALLILVFLIALPAHAVTLQQAMADPDWIGAPVQTPYWSVDGKSIYYRLKQQGTPIRDLHRIDPHSGADTLIAPELMAHADGGSAVFDAARQRAAFVRNGDIFLRHLADGRLQQITRSAAQESSPQFSADQRALHFRAGNEWFVHDLHSGVTGVAAVVKTEDDPAQAKPDDLAELQQRLFSTLRSLKSDREAKTAHEDAFQRGDSSRVPLPFFLGKQVTIIGSSLSPDRRRLLVLTTPKDYDAGRIAKLQHYVTDSGYEEQEDERVRVGRNAPASNTVWLLDLAAHTQHALDASQLPGIYADPLAEVRKENSALLANRAKADAPAAGKPPRDKQAKGKDKDSEKTARPFNVMGVEWNRSGSQVAIQLRAIDNKDRWIVGIDADGQHFVNQHRLHDPAWINWSFNDFGWSHDGQRLWYLSEETGYSHLYSKPVNGKALALTKGEFEASDPQLSPDGAWFYLRSNAQAPYSYDIYRVASSGGELQRITHQQGLAEFALSPDGNQLALLYSSSYVPAQLAVQAATGGQPRELTDTRTVEYKAMRWPELQIVGVPSTHVAQPIWSKLYKPADFDASKQYPAVIFVHGAGYLQNTELGFPNYFREQMFHNLLTERGYVVLDMDFRASQGYGRDWRTAIYRKMGHPELEDLIDGANWLAQQHGVDPKRVGLYGGSYGGFMTLMAMFRAPDVFSAGAALRPVTDWTSYNHPYTSNILNTPQVDPIAYARSSPIEFADGLKGGLLIAHGMIDDNVLYQDSVRLFQRLVELRKDDFELAGYPLERHGFVHSDSWYDEYRRILKLFDSHLKP